MIKAVTEAQEGHDRTRGWFRVGPGLRDGVSNHWHEIHRRTCARLSLSTRAWTPPEAAAPQREACKRPGSLADCDPMLSLKDADDPQESQR